MMFPLEGPDWRMEWNGAEYRLYLLLTNGDRVMVVLPPEIGNQIESNFLWLQVQRLEKEQKK